MTFIINNLKWIMLALVMTIPLIIIFKVSIFLIKEGPPEHRPPLTFEEFKKRGLNK